MNDFIKEGVKVGDRLYSVAYGWGNVIYIDPIPTPVIEVKHYSGEKIAYYPNGCIFHLDNAPCSLFWDEPKFEIPTNSKREVEVKLFNGKTANVHVDLIRIFDGNNNMNITPSDLEDLLRAYKSI